MDKANLERQLRELEAKITHSYVEIKKQESQLEERVIKELEEELYVSGPLSEFYNPYRVSDHDLDKLWNCLQRYFSYRSIQGKFTPEYQGKIEKLLSSNLDDLTFLLTMGAPDFHPGAPPDTSAIIPPFALEQQLLETLLRKILHTGISYFDIKMNFNTFLYRTVEELNDLEFMEFYKSRGYSVVNCSHNFKSGYPVWTQEVRKSYDVGVAIATGGLYAAYLFDLAGLPIMEVEMKRKGPGASWKPRENFQGEKLAGKKVLILENDIVTGRTLRRAVRELQQYAPASIGVCFMENKAHCGIRNLPPEISRSYHFITGSTEAIGTDNINTIPLEKEGQLILALAQRLDAKYNIFRKEEHD